MLFERLMYSCHRFLIALTVVGATLVFFSFQMFFTSWKPTVSFQDLRETKAKEGMHIKGNVVYALDCFAYMETWTEKEDGTKTPAKTSSYYYAVPGVDGTFFAIEVSPSDFDAMETLANETIEYAEGGLLPNTLVNLEGRMSKIDGEMLPLFQSYLKEIGYSDEDIANMGNLLYVEIANMNSARLSFFAGLLMFIVGIAIIVIRFIKSKELVAYGY